MSSNQILPQIRKRKVSLFLETYNEWHIYWCSDCRSAIFKYKGQNILEVPGEAPMELPIEIRCPNKQCGKIILVEGFAKHILDNNNVQ